MSFVIAAPEMVAAAACDLASIGSTISSANASAVAPTTGVIAAAADEVSAAIAALFGAHGQAYHELGAKAAAFHNQFVQAMNANAATYASSEAVNVSVLQTIKNLSVFRPLALLTGRPLIGGGTGGAGGAAGDPGTGSTTGATGSKGGSGSTGSHGQNGNIGLG